MSLVGLFALLSLTDPPRTAPSTPLRDEFNRPIRQAEPARARPTAKRTKQAAPPPSPCAEDMALIRGGTFASKRIKPFCLDIEEVTVAAFAAYLAKLEAHVDTSGTSGPTRKRLADLRRSLGTVSWEWIDRPGNEIEKDSHSARCTWRTRKELPNHPINCVDPKTARAYCESHGKRLPSGREWQWAARGGSKAHRYPWGSAAPSFKYANYAGAEGTGRIQGVGQYAATPSGLRDLAGNLSEWVECAPDEPSCSARGGNFRTSEPAELRVTHVDTGFRLTDRSDVVGFRCAAKPRTRGTR